MREKPVLKWPGNKINQVERIVGLLPKGRRLIEPFVGSGAVFMNTDYDDYILADINPDLINFYRTLRTLKERFIACAASLFGPANNCAEVYYQRRDEFNQAEDTTQRALLFLYLNKHCYNGLYRVNARGGFNVPFGRYAKPYFPGAEMSKFLSKAPKAIFWACDFERTMKEAERGDVLYIDSPFVPLSATANFTTYTAGGFTLADQKRLVVQAKALALRGVPVLMSNHDNEFTRELYAEATLHVYFDVQRNISCVGDNRGRAPEVLALFGARC